MFIGETIYPADTDQPLSPSQAESFAAAFDKAWEWWSLVLCPEYLPAGTRARLRGFENRQRGDDWIVARYSAGGADFQIIDGRSITIAVLPPPQWAAELARDAARRPLPWSGPQPDGKEDLLPQAPELFKDRTEKLKNFVKVTFRRMLHYDLGMESMPVPVQVTSTGGNENEAYGFISAKGPLNGWIKAGGVTWWTDGTVVVFNVARLMKLPAASCEVSAGSL